MIKTNSKNSNSVTKALEKYHKRSLKKLKKTQQKALTGAKSNTVSILGGALLASGISTVGSGVLPPKDSIVSLTGDEKKANEKLNEINKSKLVAQVDDKLLEDPAKLTAADEIRVEKALSYKFGVDLKVNLDGNRLNQVWGYFGQEQHLYRWQGDTLDSHGEYLGHGIAPATGAFGYFDNAEQEKYYIAAPIHMLPTWNTDWPILKPWYKFRKVLVYNPKNGKAIVAVIGDAGPAQWTGKNFGGSPEVMHYLQMVDGSQKSRAIVLFIDESSGKVDLGPLDSKSNLVALAN